MWCIPPEANAEFVWRMEEILSVYKLPYDPERPLVCMDESSKQLVAEVRTPRGLTPGRTACVDYEYQRKGTCNLFMFFEPLRGWRRVWVTGQRRKVEWACCVKALLEENYPQAKKVLLVCDNLNTHTGGALYQAFPPGVAKAFRYGVFPKNSRKGLSRKDLARRRSSPILTVDNLRDGGEMHHVSPGPLVRLDQGTDEDLSRFEQATTQRAGGVVLRHDPGALLFPG
jgi:DDE superfamily endonuclease